MAKEIKECLRHKTVQKTVPSLKVIRSFMNCELVLQVASCKKKRVDLISI